MKLFRLTLVLMLTLMLILILNPLVATAQNSPECLTQSQADFLFTNFKVSHWDDVQKQLIPITEIPDLCDPASLIQRLAKAVDFINELNAYQDPHSPSVISREGAGHYFKKRIARIEIEPKNSPHCSPGVIAYVYRLEKEVMHICSGGISNFESPLMMSYILLHEARHIDGFSHVPCTHGTHRKSDAEDRDGSGSCDSTYEYQGSYGVAAGFMGEIAKFSQDPVQRQQARSTLVVDLIQRFNELPLDIKPGLLAQTNEGEISFFDGSQRTSLLKLPHPQVLLTLRGDLPTFFDPDGSVTSFVFSPTLIETKGDYAWNYAKSYSYSERQSLKDVYYGDLHDYSCLLFDSKIRCGDNFANDPDIEISLGSLQPLQFLISENSVLVNKETLYIATAEGALYPLPPTWSDFKIWSQEARWESSAEKFYLSSLVSIAPNNSLEYAVDFSGRLMKFTPRTKKWSEVEEFKGAQLQKIVGPFFWSQKLEDL